MSARSSSVIPSRIDGKESPARGANLAALGMTPFDVQTIRDDFPILKRTVRGEPLVYLDNAATTQKPQAVIDRIVRYYTQENSNVHRGVHYLSEVATAAYESARTTVKRFLAEPHAPWGRRVL